MHFVVIGNGVAGITAALTLRERESAAKITLISGESDYFFSRTALMYAYMDRMTLRDLEPLERKSFDAQRIARVRDRVTDIDASAKMITLQSGQAMQYDALLLATGSSPNQLNVPGVSAAKQGMVNFVTLQDLEQCEKHTRLGGNAVVVGGGLIGIELVECLVHHGMKVDFMVRDPWYWPAALDKEEAAMVTEHMRHHRVNVLLEESVVEIKSNNSGKVEAVIGSSGKRYDVELLGVAVGVHPSIEWLAATRTAPKVNRGILVDSAFRTSLPHVWAAGDCVELASTGLVEQIWYSAKRQGELAAKSILGDAIDYRPPIFYNSSKFFDIEFTTTGKLGAESFYHRVEGKEISIRVSWENSAVTGFNMLGSRWNHEFFERWITERRTPEYVMNRLHEAQFDGEFGRLPLNFNFQRGSK